MPYRFADFLLDPARRALRRGDQPVAIQPKAFDMLVCLVTHRDRVVPKDELLDRLWPNEAVTEWSLTFCIKKVRKALGDTDPDRPLVATLHGRGYRFVADVVECAAEAASAPPTPPPTPPPAELTRYRLTLLGYGERSPFVGRAAELARLDATIDEVRRGAFRTVLVGGEPGIGKTRLMAELAARAAAAGCGVHAGRCLEEASPVYWPWLEVVRSYLADHPPEVARTLLGDAAGDIARVLPVVRSAAPDVLPSPEVDPDHGRLLFFDGMTCFLGAAARRQPLVLLLDDLQWADTSSLHLLRALIDGLGEAPLLIAATYRDAGLDARHPLRRIEAVLRRERRGYALRLHGLSPAESQDLARASVHASLSDQELAPAIAAAEGNPFFLEELCRDLHEQSASGTPPAARVPAGVRDILLARLCRLGTSCATTLGMAALIGREFRLDVLASVADRPVEELLDALEAARDARLVVEDTDTPGTFAFAHALIAHTLASDFLHTRRRDIHRRIARALEGVWCADLDEHAGEIARHYELAAGGEDGVDLATAFEWLLRSARRAAECFSWSDAAAAVEHALRLLDGRAGEHRRLRAALLMEGGRYFDRAGDGTTSRRMFGAAADIARTLGDTDLFAHAALGMVGKSLVSDAQTIDMLEEALLTIAPEDSQLRVRLLGRLVTALHVFPEHQERRRSLCLEAVAMARRLGDPGALLHALTEWHLAFWRQDHLTERLHVADEHLALATRVGALPAQCNALSWRIVARLESGNLRDARADMQQHAALAEQLRLPAFRQHASSFAALDAYLDCRWEDAERLAERAYHLGRRLDEMSAFMTYWATTYFIRREQGRVAEIEPAMRAYFATVVHGPWDWLKATLESDLDNVDEAQRYFETIAAGDFTSVAPDGFHNSRLPALAALAEVAVRLGRQRDAARLYDLLLPYQNQWVVVGFGCPAMGAVSHFLGLLAATLATHTDRRRDARRWFEAALDSHDRNGAALFAMKSRLAWGALLQASERTTDRRQATALLRTAAHEADRRRHVRMRAAIDRLLPGGASTGLTTQAPGHERA